MMGEPMQPFVMIGAAFGAAISSSASDARITGSCQEVASRAALEDVARTPAQGQMRVASTPYEISPGVLRVEVDVNGADMLVFSVDVTIDGACKVLATSARQETSPQNGGK
jgi:hypothetical protein